MPESRSSFVRSVLFLVAFGLALPGSAALAADSSQAHYFLPDINASRIVTVARDGSASAAVTILTQAVAIKETGPKETIRKFGEVYAFNPAFIVLRQDEPTLISLLNLQPDDEHDLMLTDSEFRVLTYVDLPALGETSYVFTFHRAGLYKFYCTMHPAMEGQILVIPR